MLLLIKILKTDASFQSYASPSPTAFEDVVVELARSEKVFGLRVAGCEEDVEKIKIKGDGHCMFRSFAYKLLQQLDLKPEARGVVLTKLHEFKDLIMSPDHDFIQEQIPDFEERIDFIFDRIASGVSALDLLNDPECSDGLVKSLRVLACASNMLNPDFNFIDEGGRFDHEFAYYQAMMNFDERLWGGEEESNALARVFGTRNFVFNFSSNRVSVQAPPMQLAQAINICFYFKPGHYDALNISDVTCQEILTRGALDIAFQKQGD
jgi:Peptidase C65 Otubain